MAGNWFENSPSTGSPGGPVWNADIGRFVNPNDLEDVQNAQTEINNAHYQAQVKADPGMLAQGYERGGALGGTAAYVKRMQDAEAGAAAQAPVQADYSGANAALGVAQGTRRDQSHLAQALSSAAYNGTGPSMAAGQFASGRDASLGQALSQANGGRGASTMGQMSAMNAGAAMTGQAAQAAGQQRAGEISDSRSQLAMALGGMRGADLATGSQSGSQADTQAGLAMQSRGQSDDVSRGLLQSELQAEQARMTGSQGYQATKSARELGDRSLSMGAGFRASDMANANTNNAINAIGSGMGMASSIATKSNAADAAAAAAAQKKLEAGQ